MGKMVKETVGLLKGEYLEGFKNVEKALNTGVIQEGFKEEVLGDILELFIRNQENGKAFNDVIGGDFEGFLRDILDVYLEDVPQKTKLMNAAGCGLVISGLFTLWDMFTGIPSSMASVIIAIVGFIFGGAMVLLSYKASKKVNPRKTVYIFFIGGFLCSFLSDVLYSKVSFIQSASNTAVNGTILVIVAIIEIILGLVITKKVMK